MYIGICVLLVYTNIYVHIYYITDNTTLRPDVFYAITHNTSGNINTTNMSGNEWNISVQAYEFSITPVNMFTNGNTISKCIMYV